MVKELIWVALITLGALRKVWTLYKDLLWKVWTFNLCRCPGGIVENWTPANLDAIKALGKAVDSYMYLYGKVD